MGERGNGNDAGGVEVPPEAEQPRVVELGPAVFVATGQPPPAPGPGSLPVIPVPGGYIQFSPKPPRVGEEPEN